MKTITKGFGFPVSKMLFISSYFTINDTKTVSLMIKSWKGNIVDDQLFNRSDAKCPSKATSSMFKLFKSVYLHRLFHMGESDYLLYFHIYLCYLSDYLLYLFPYLSERLLALFHIYMWYLPDITGQILPVRLHVTYHTSHFFISHFLLFNNASLHRLFRMG